MPEYSGTTISPADGVQVPAMNGASGGNFLLSALRNYILASKGLANGLASLDGNGKLPAAQLPDLADDVIVVASYATLPAQGESGKIYITADNNKMYRWDSNASDYVELSVDLSAYATKAEVNALSARVSNLEQTTKQDEQTVQYPDDGNYSSLMPNKVPLSVADYAEVPRFRGKSRAWNQLVQNGNFDGTSYWNYDGASFSQSGNKGIVVGDSNYANLYKTSFQLISGHTYLAFGTAKASASITIGLYLGTSSRVNFDTKTVTANAETFFAGVGTYTTQDNVLQFGCESGAGGASVEFSKVAVRDLTLIFPEGVPATIAECVQKCPDLLKYDAYDAGSLVDTTYSGVESVGRNLFEGVLQIGGLDYSTGAETANSELRRSPYIQVKPSTEYYFLLVSGKLGLVHFYDFNKNHIEAREAGSGTLLTTSPASAFYVRFNSNLAIDVSLWDSADLCVNQSDSQNGTYTPYQKNTLSLPSPVTLRSAGSVADELDVESGVITRKVREWNLEDLVWSWIDSYWASGTIKDYIKKPSSNSVNADIVAEKYVVSNWSAGGNMTIAVLTTGLIGIEYADSVNSPTGKIYFALATPTTESLTPIPDNFVKVQAGGTINTIQSQSPVIDNCLDVTYDIIP